MDRTYWKFSNTNILTLGIIYESKAFQIVFKMMDKRGNANTEERMELIRRFRVIRHGKESKSHWLFTDLKLGDCKHLSGIYYAKGQPCYLSGSKIKKKEGKPELQSLASYCNAEDWLDMYRQRKQIETMSKGLKSSGINIEDSHIRIQERMANLFSIVMIAYIWCYLVGFYIHKTSRR